MRSLVDLVSVTWLAHASEEDVLARGVAAFDANLVRDLEATETELRAIVAGAERHEIRIAVAEDALRCACSCTPAPQLRVCEHIVAVALAWIHHRDPDSIESVCSRDGSLLARVRLTNLGANALAEMLVDHAVTDVRLSRRIEARLAVARPDADAVHVVRRILDQATETLRFVDHRAVSGFANGVGDSVDAVEALVHGGSHPAAAVELALHAIERIESAVLSADDSWDEIGNELRRAQAIHLDACCRAKPTPRDLAGVLFAKELGSALGAFDRAAWTYRDVLGPDGLAEYRRLLELERRALATTPGRRVPPQDVELHRRRLDAIARAIDEAQGNGPAQV